MILNEAVNIKLGSRQVQRVYVGTISVWPGEHKFLDIDPDMIWLTEANDYTDSVEIISNTSWNIINP